MVKGCRSFFGRTDAGGAVDYVPVSARFPFRNRSSERLWSQEGRLARPKP